MSKIFILLIFLSAGNAAFAQEKLRISSPDGNIIFKIYAYNTVPSYSVSYKSNSIIEESQINMHFAETGKMHQAYITAIAAITEVLDNYNLIIGKTAKVKTKYRRTVISFSDKTNPAYFLQIEIKLFNDAVAFRYLFPAKKANETFTILDENTSFNFAGNPVIKALLVPNYITSHEGLYTTVPLSSIKNDTLMDMPALFQFPHHIYAAVTEANLQDYAGMYLCKTDGILATKLSPLPGQAVIKVRAVKTFHSPWRVILISDRLGALIESNVLTSLCPQTLYKNTAWIKTGTTTFPWWNGTVVPANINGGNNFETNKYFIDFCTANNIKYHTVVEFGGHEWYSNDGEGYQPGKNYDVTKPVDGLNMKQVCDYAKSKNVGIRVWVHWKALYPLLDEAFKTFEEWGLAGMMVDFMDRDDQEMVNIQTEILQKAAAHHLHIQFHGAYKPTGLSRTYPNEFTREGTLNYENHKWNKLVTPNADLDVVFTRLLAGSTDYHLGGFNALPVSKFVVQNIKPYTMGTRCHMLAMYVVLENEQGMLCDYPAAYLGEPGFEVLRNIPTTWNETKVLNAEVDKFITVARRKNNNWYIASIADSTGKIINIDCSFLLKGKNYNAKIYSDASDANEYANHLTIKKIKVNNATKLSLKMQPGGGNIIILQQIEK